MRFSRLLSLGVVAVLSSPALAQTEPSNNTPHALACMKRYGFTYAQWRAYAVPPEKAEPYRQCRDGRSGRNAGGSVRATCFARAGVTERQWQSRQATYAQGAVVKECMAEHGQDILVRRKNGSTLY